MGLKARKEISLGGGVGVWENMMYTDTAILYVCWQEVGAVI